VRISVVVRLVLGSRKNFLSGRCLIPTELLTRVLNLYIPSLVDCRPTIVQVNGYSLYRVRRFLVFARHTRTETFCALPLCLGPLGGALMRCAQPSDAEFNAARIYTLQRSRPLSTLDPLQCYFTLVAK